MKDYFTLTPRLRSVFYLGAGYVSGIHYSPKERKIRHHFISPLEKGSIQPSFNKKNIEKRSLLEEKLKEGIEKLHLADQKTACLLPELSLKAFVFSFDSLPSSPQQREKIIRFRVKKQMAFLPADARLSFKVIGSDHSKKVVVSVARTLVVQEYEDFFHQLGLKVRMVGSPVLSLYNMTSRNGEDEFLLINIEEESISFVAVIDSEMVLYRQKPFVVEWKDPPPLEKKMESIFQEIENTANFIEDNEKRRIQSLFVRFGFLDTGGEIIPALKDKLSLPVSEIDIPMDSDLNLRQRQLLLPLMGIIL